MTTALFPVTIRVHWVDTDAAGIVWFGNFFRYFEAAEDEAFRALGQERMALLRSFRIFMPRVDASCRYRFPARAGELLEIGVAATPVNARRIEWRFEVREQASRRLIAEGSYRIACVASDTFEARDFPAEIPDLLAGLESLATEGRHA